ncbi:MAG: hypothetical protein EOO43_25680, partial [Flavobacterium sp.]
MIQKLTRYSTIRVLFLFCFLSFKSSFGQEIKNIPNGYYYNNFDGGQIGSSFTQIGATPAFAISSPAATNSLATTNGYCLNSLGNSTAGGYSLSFINQGTDLNNEPYGFEWTLLYKNTGANPDNSDVVSNGENAWKYWLYAENNNLTTAKGYFLTQVGTTMYVRYKYDNSTDGSHYNNLISFDLSSLGGNNTTYAIRVQRLKRGGQFVWHLFLDTYASSAQGKTERGGTGAYEGTVNTYGYSALLSSSTSTGRFKFDEMKMYSMHLSISGANQTSNGISNPLSAGQQNAIIYGLQLDSRGYFDMYQ